jgi:hypothetical protein
LELSIGACSSVSLNVMGKGDNGLYNIIERSSKVSKAITPTIRVDGVSMYTSCSTEPSPPIPMAPRESPLSTGLVYTYMASDSLVEE